MAQYPNYKATTVCQNWLDFSTLMFDGSTVSLMWQYKNFSQSIINFYTKGEIHSKKNIYFETYTFSEHLHPRRFQQNSLLIICLNGHCELLPLFPSTLPSSYKFFSSKKPWYMFCLYRCSKFVQFVVWGSELATLATLAIVSNFHNNFYPPSVGAGEEPEMVFLCIANYNTSYSSLMPN